MEFFSMLSSNEFLSAFIVLFAVIDPIGIMPFNVEGEEVKFCHIMK